MMDVRNDLRLSFIVLLVFYNIVHAYIPIKINFPGLILHVNVTIENDTQATSNVQTRIQDKTSSTILPTITPLPEKIKIIPEPKREIQKAVEWKYVGLYSMQKNFTLDYLHSSQWGRQNLACTGHRQSPIDIDPKNIRSSSVRLWNNFDEIPKEMMLINNGNTIQIIGNWKNTPFLLGPGILPYRGRYVFSDATFHWTRQGNGSEHVIRGRRYTIETQLLFYKERGNKDIMDAVDKDDHIAIISVLFILSENDDNCLKEILNGVPDVKFPRTMKKIQPFPLMKLMPLLSRYFIYSGSISVPPCTETATWLVMEQNLSISKPQLQILRQIVGNDNNTIITNSRVINGRMLGHI